MNFPTGQVRGWGLRCYVQVKVAQSCSTLCEPTDYTVNGILQTRILEWVAFPFSGDLPNTGIKPMSHVVQADSLPLSHQGYVSGDADTSGRGTML